MRNDYSNLESPYDRPTLEPPAELEENESPRIMRVHSEYFEIETPEPELEPESEEDEKWDPLPHETYEDEDGPTLGLESEESDYEILPLSPYEARLANNVPTPARKLPEISLVVDRWKAAETAKIAGARLKLYECDVDEPNRSDKAAAKDTQIGEFTFDLQPSPEYVKNPTQPNIPRVAVVNAKWANATLEKSYKATKLPDFTLLLGARSFPMWMPREDILEEGAAIEIGFEIEDPAGHKVTRMRIAQGHTLNIAIQDQLQVLLSIPGRFDDPNRDSAVDRDGTKFDEFLKGGNRRDFITKWLNDHARLKEASTEPNADLKTGDILKAWFVIHDVGVAASLTDKRFKASDATTKAGAVHGFLNRAGYFAATHDFTKNRQGTVYEFLSKAGLTNVNGRTINLETVPDIEADVPDKSNGTRSDPSNADQYASIGYRRRGKKVTYYKWTKEAFDVLAELYIFASARARHLLTITVHKEMDRNLARSVLWREYTAAEMRAGTGKHWDTARSHPSNYHGDPYGFNVQALYDVITQKLNALGGKQMPSGARYGIHPRRVTKSDGQDIGNGDSHKHEFPHQSNPSITTDTGMKKAGWWNA